MLSFEKFRRHVILRMQEMAACWLLSSSPPQSHARAPPGQVPSGRPPSPDTSPEAAGMQANSGSREAKHSLFAAETSHDLRS